jgi:hypothetical protein
VKAPTVLANFVMRPTAAITAITVIAIEIRSSSRLKPV